MFIIVLDVAHGVTICQFGDAITCFVQDAWLDNVEVDTKFAGKAQKKKDKEEEFQDLSSDDIGKIKWRIACMLEPAETVCSIAASV